MWGAPRDEKMTEHEGGVIKLIRADMKAVSFLSVLFMAAMPEGRYL